jgi:CDP-diacylglycerol--glycerol-3-phosphate 3-phosphatidyltransferase/cardiolipin synthase
LVALGALILSGGFPHELWMHQVGIASLWAAAGLTLVTGYDYLRIGLRHMD